MRVTDRILQQSFLYNLEKHKVDMQTRQEQITTGSKVNRPSDSPAGTSRILRLQNQLGGLNTFQKNIDNALSSLDASVLSLNGIGSEIEDVLVNMTSINNPTVTDLNSYATKLEMAIDSIFNFANSKFDGQYLFGGTNNSADPFVKSGSTINSSSNNIGGEQKIRISTNISQKINITGSELFFPSIQQSGNLESGMEVNDTTTKSEKILDPDGNEYDLNITYKKTAANTYKLDYKVIDSNSNPVFDSSNPQHVIKLEFGADGALSKINDKTPTPTSIVIDDGPTGIKINFDVKSLTESASPSSIYTKQTQQADIFKTLISVKEGLQNGIKPNNNQIQIIEEFSQHVINKTTDAGSIMNKLTSTNDLLNSQTIELKELLGSERDVDIAEAIMELNNTQFNLDMSYKISSMILPKSLMDFL